jgi:hypothetical protein
LNREPIKIVKILPAAKATNARILDFGLRNPWCKALSEHSFVAHLTENVSTRSEAVLSQVEYRRAIGGDRLSREYLPA